MPPDCREEREGLKNLFNCSVFIFVCAVNELNPVPCWACVKCVLPQGKFSALVICQTGGEGLLLVAIIRGCIILFAYLLN